MIIKEIDDKLQKDKFTISGIKAEKEMAFYLRRNFADADDVHIVNDLRFEHNGEIAQIDHLIIHEFGFIIIESRSVTTRVSINKANEWIRHFNGQKGMKSPINQAKLQLKLLQKFLDSKKEDLDIKNRLGSYSPLIKFNFEVLVAISDDGIIERDSENNLPEGYHDRLRTG